MRTVRRIYFYAISLISLEVAVWGVIGLLRTILNRQVDSGMAGLLAGGLSQVLVAVPIFLIHWLAAQREAGKDAEERASQVRALFHYAARLAVLLPIAQNFLALFNRLLLTLFGLQSTQALIGAGQTAADNLTALAVNLLVFAYLDRILKTDWRLVAPQSTLHSVRRLFWVVWMLYTLLLAAGGVCLLLQYVFFLPENTFPFEVFQPVNGLTLAAAGLPLWAHAWLKLKSTREIPGEGKSALRLAAIYLLALAGILTVLGTGAAILYNAVSALTGDGRGFVQLVRDSAGPLSFAAVFAVIWAFFQRELEEEFALMQDAALVDGLRRIYDYLLALAGLASAFAGLQQLLSFLVHFTLERSVNMEAFRSLLAGGLGLLLVALPVWVGFWNRVQAGAQLEDDRGDHARRSPVRKGYLYLVLFLTVVGGMGTAGMVLYLTISRLLGNENPTFAVDVANWGQSFLLLLVLLLYHLRVLRADGRRLQLALARRHAAFPVLILSGGADGFLAEVRERLARELPELPVRVVDGLAQAGAPGAKFSALLLDGDLLAAPPAWLPGYLAGFPGEKIVLPAGRSGWTWLGARQSEQERLRDAVAAVRQLAEGQAVRPGMSANPWVVVGYVLGALFGIQLLFVILSIVISSIG